MEITHNDKELTLLQDAYISGCHPILGDHYTAAAQDVDGNDYTIVWAIINRDCEDESMACDWSKPYEITN